MLLRRSDPPRHVATLALCAVAQLAAALPASAAEHHGAVRFHGFAVPGASVVATQGSAHFETTTDAAGVYRFANLPDGRWHLVVSMPGFAPLESDVDVPGSAAPSGTTVTAPASTETTAASPSPAAAPTTPAATVLELKMLPTAEVLSIATPRAIDAPPPPAPAPPDFAKAGSKPADKPADKPAGAEPPPPAPEAAQAADGLLVNGSNNNAATSQFSLDRAFGNQRSGSRALYTGGLAVIAGNSIFDARPYSLTGVPQPKNGYSRLSEVLTFGGPLNIPHLLHGRMFKGPNFYLVYERTRNRDQASPAGLMPTQAQRDTVTDPVARALLAYYPLPNLFSSANYNYQVQVLNNTHEDNLQLRLDRGIGQRDQVRGNIALASTREDTHNVFGFRDATDTLGLNVSAGWQHRVRAGMYLDLDYRFSRLRSDVTPFFKNRVNVSGNAGLTGNLQDAFNWGPPTLVFSSGIASLTDAVSAFNRNRTDGVSAALRIYRGKHNITAGGDFRRQQFNYLQQDDPRGTFTFTGAASGSDFADFARGIPDTAAINYGNPDKYLRQSISDAFVNDDWRVRPELTLNVGLRWEYAAPITETKGRLSNLDVANNFTAVTPVLASNPTGSLTGQHYPTSLLRPDRTKVQPRVSLAWRPIAGSSLVVRAGYGIYADTSVYQATALQLAQQSPFANSIQVNNATCAQTLRSGPTPCSSTTATTFAADPNFRVGYAQTWNLSAQRDLPAALVATVSYLGVKGTRGVQDFLPNTWAPGAANPCLSCPVGFRYRATNGNSNRNAGTVQVRRRLRSGFTAIVDYTYSRSVDNDSMLGGVGAISSASASSGQSSSASVSTARTSTIAQDWRNLRAERSLSNFDQRHLVNVTAQYTTGMGMRGGTLMSGWRGRVYKEWTVQAVSSFGTGLPETPVFLQAVNGTGFTGSIRPDRVAADPYRAASGHYLNAAAFAAPQTGQWGNAGRNSLRGPGTYSFNASLARTFRIEKRYNLDIRADATNLLNHVVFASYSNVINPSLVSATTTDPLQVSPLFGVPTYATDMRTVRLTARFRF